VLGLKSDLVGPKFFTGPFLAL